METAGRILIFAESAHEQVSVATCVTILENPCNFCKGFCFCNWGKVLVVFYGEIYDYYKTVLIKGFLV